MLTKSDLRGVCALPPTPCKPGAGGWDVVDSVDLEETASLVEKLIQAGVGAIGMCGTTGECAALLPEEKLQIARTVVEVVNKRVPVIVGATALGTREVVRQMRNLRDAGVDAALIGLPLWQTPTPTNSVQFYADLAEAVPDLPIMVYANSMFFKSSFPVAFWQDIAQQASTVLTCKVSYGIDHIEDDFRVAGHQINFMVPEGGLFEAYKKVGTTITACWATSAGMGPEPIVALMDAVLADDFARAQAIDAEIKALPSIMPPGADFRVEFPKYNAQIVKARSNAAGFANFGPYRAPYRDLPPGWEEHLVGVGRAWAELRKSTCAFRQRDRLDRAVASSAGSIQGEHMKHRSDRWARALSMLGLAMVAAACGGGAATPVAPTAPAVAPAAAPTSAASSPTTAAKPAAPTVAPVAPTAAATTVAATTVAATTAAAPTAAGASSAKLTISYGPIIWLAPLFIAVDKGYAEQEGLTINLVPITQGQDLIAGLASGQLDAVANGMFAGEFNAISRGVDIRIVSSMGIFPQNADPSGLFVRSDLVAAGAFADVTSLKGKKIAVSGGLGSGASYALAVILARGNLTLDDVDLQNMSGVDSVTALRNKAIDGAIQSEPFTTQLIQDKVAEMPEFGRIRGMDLGAAIYGPRLLHQDTELGKKLMVALLKGARDVQGDKARDPGNIEILSKYTTLPVAVLQNMSSYDYRPDLSPNPTGYQDMQQVFRKANVITFDPLPPEQVVDLSFIQYAATKVN